MKFKFVSYAARFWASHAVETETKRNVQLEMAILDTFSCDERRKAMEQLRTDYYTKQKSLLHVLIHNRLAFICMNPVSKEEYRMYFLILFKLIVRVRKVVFTNGAINASDGDGQSLLQYAARNGYLEPAKFLVKEDGAEVEAKDSNPRFSPGGQTPLSFAAANGQLEVAEFLVKEGSADVESKDKDGRTALDLTMASVGWEKQDWEMEEQWERRTEGYRAMAAWLEKEAALEGPPRITDRSRPGLT